MKISSVSLIASLLMLFALYAYSQKVVPEDFCISDDEYHLYELINAHRAINGLDAVPLSASLCYVARTHVVDLYTNHPDTSICNLNSWSDKGDWTPCCHNKYVPMEDCIRNKPKELTNYSGEGYELAYAEIFDTHPDTVFRFWEKIDAASHFILNQDKWKDKSWRAMGVGIYKSYAVLWMGQRRDAMPAPETCSDIKEKKERKLQAETSGTFEVLSTATSRYYIIIASFQSVEDAEKEAKRYLEVKNSDLKILKNNQGQYRVSISDYPSLAAAKQGKAQLGNKFKDAWILEF
ncbi:MAG: SPOR domain-containing protein [Bacteroidales bacterium]|nr:SPOR domain-containing protein [Bacteroidales bacterium]